MPSPRGVPELQSALGLVNYYRHFCPNFAQMAQPLYTLLKKGVVFRWGERQQRAMDALKAAITEEGRVLRRLDPNKPIVLHTDWSHLGVGAVLGQLDENGQEYMCACISRSLNKHERNYSSYQGEMLAVVWAVHTLRPYLHGVHFTVVTDHLPLQWLMTSRELTGQHARWALSLQEFDFTVEHRPGIKHQNADVLSRCPLPTTFDGTGARLDGSPCDTMGVAACLAMLPVTGWKAGPMGVVAAVTECHALGTAADAVRPELAAPEAGLVLPHMPDHSQERKAQREQAALAGRAATWVNEAMQHPVPALLPANETRHPLAAALPPVDSRPVDVSFFSSANKHGVILMELFGGLCAGLEMVLRNGLAVHRYLYCDRLPLAQRVARARMMQLQALYPSQLAVSAVQDALTALPQDVEDIDERTLLAL
jgi:hypothetical protein